MFQVTALYAGALGLAFVSLSFWVSLIRIKYRISRGDGGNRILAKAIRVQGNATEYLPLGLVLIALCEAQGLSAPALHGFGLALLFGRALHFVGFMSSPQILPLRQSGMILTYGTLLATSLILIIGAMN